MFCGRKAGRRRFVRGGVRVKFRLSSRRWGQKEGVGIGNVANGALANGTLLVGERKMLKEMKEQGYRVLFHKRYIDDILAIFEHQDGL